MPEMIERAVNTHPQMDEHDQGLAKKIKSHFSLSRAPNPAANR